HPGPQGIELVSRERAVDGTPGDIGTGGRLIDDETVHGRTAGTLTSLHDQSSGIGQLTLIALDRQIGRASCRRRVWITLPGAEVRIRDCHVTGVQTCALPISPGSTGHRTCQPGTGG